MKEILKIGFIPHLILLLFIGTLVGLYIPQVQAGEKEELALLIENCQLKMELMREQFAKISDLLNKSQEKYKQIIAKEQEEARAKEKAKEKQPEAK